MTTKLNSFRWSSHLLTHQAIRQSCGDQLLFPRDRDRLLLDLRSCERALLAIPFFDEHLPRRLAKVIEGEIVNKLFAVEGNVKLTPDFLFDHQKSEFESNGARPEIERLPIHYYEEGITGFRLAVLVRQMAAREHWFGNTDYTLHDAIVAITSAGR